MRLAGDSIKLNIEIKVSSDEPEIASAVVGIIRAEKFTKSCMITSFDLGTIEEVQRIAPEIKTGLIFGRDYSADVFTGAWEVLSCNQEIVNQYFVDHAKEVGKEVHVWTVNDEMSMTRLINLGVDGIITNYPDLLEEVLSTVNLR
jgi:glycerophosphoryl diester phosphodiesterase